MTIVRQINDYTCFLACLESFFADAGTKRSQQAIIDDFPEETHKGSLNEGLFELTGPQGSTNAENLQKRYGFKMAHRQPDFDRLSKSDFIGAENMKDQGCNHIVRFYEHADCDRIRVMDPKICGFDCWTRAEFLRYRCYVLKVST
jgi:hypothetical protein